MSANLPSDGLQLLSTLEADGTLRLSLGRTPVVQPGDSEVTIAVEAAPINPSDMMTMFASADPAQAAFAGEGEPRTVTARVTAEAAGQRAGRFGQPLAVGLECAGTVIAAGTGAEHLIGERVAAISLTRGAFGQYLTVAAAQCAPLPDDVSSAEGAGVFCNPMTALAMVETLRLEGHGAMIQTAAASNLGQMIVHICREDGIGLVNVVRRPEQAELLRALGAEHVVDSSLPTFREDLRRAAAATGARAAFDAIGGGTMVHELHMAMEHAAIARMGFYSPYGSPELKQVYIYGRLDTSPTVIDAGAYGMLWDVRHWYQGATMERVSQQRAGEMLARVLAGLKTTFASHYARTIPLAEALERDTMLAYARQATGEKFLIDPRL